MNNLITVLSSVDVDTFDDIRFNIHWDTLMEIQANLENILGFILGLIAFAIVIFTTLVTSCDVAYLTFPNFQQYAHKMNWDGTIDESKFRLISPQARDATIVAATRETGTSVIGVYFKLRMKMLFISTFVLVIILVGNDLFISIVVNITVQILKAFWLY